MERDHQLRGAEGRVGDMEQGTSAMDGGVDRYTGGDGRAGYGMCRRERRGIRWQENKSKRKPGPAIADCRRGPPVRRFFAINVPAGEECEL